MFRKLAKIVLIDEIKLIDNADSIELAICGGWQCVVKKGEVSVNDKVVYFEIDSFIPHTLAPFLSKGKEPRIFNGISGERLKTVKLRGALSQGLILPLSIVDGIVSEDDLEIGKDLTEILNIQLWEPPLQYTSSGMPKGNFPIFIPKTDQERIQNLKHELESYKDQQLEFEITEKLDGSSMTVYVNGDESGVCSRNLDLKFEEDNQYWYIEKKYDIINKLKSLNRNIAIQGEIIGEKIQGNYYKITEKDFYVFDIYDIDARRYFTSDERIDLCNILGFKHVPVLEKYFRFSTDANINSILLTADDVSLLNVNVDREGLVFKCTRSPDIHFKAISNKFLLKN